MSRGRSGRAGKSTDETWGSHAFPIGNKWQHRPPRWGLAGQELALPSWQQAVDEDWLGK
jgi:hypothetical protein